MVPKRLREQNKVLSSVTSWGQWGFGRVRGERSTAATPQGSELLAQALRGSCACLISFSTSFPLSAFSASSNEVTAAGSQQAVFILC